MKGYPNDLIAFAALSRDTSSFGETSVPAAGTAQPAAADHKRQKHSRPRQTQRLSV